MLGFRGRESHWQYVFQVGGRVQVAGHMCWVKSPFREGHMKRLYRVFIARRKKLEQRG